MKRRQFFAVLGGAIITCPAAVLSQQLPKRPLIGWLGGATRASGSRQLGGLIRGLLELGYIEGSTIDIEYRWAEGDLTRQPAQAKELVELKPAVIIAANEAGALAAKRATTTIPIVCPSLYEPVRRGVITSQARPGGNVTGILFLFEGLTGKQVELVMELVPGVSGVGMLFNTASDMSSLLQRELEVAAKARHIKFVTGEVRSRSDIEAAFQELARNVQAVIVPADAMFLTEAHRIVPWLAAARVPGIHSYREHVEASGLISYGVNLPENFRRAALFVDKILKGAKPGDLPVEFPTKLELVVNSRTARELGLAIPQSILLRADEVIE
jgi:putative ABC transport system substrate-binding protein